MLVRESLYNFKRDGDPIVSSGLGVISLIDGWLKKYNITKYIINDDLTIDVNGDVELDNKNLVEIPEYIQFNIINGAFYIFNNNELKSLKGCPLIVKDDFNCRNNKLKTLEYCPEKIGGNFFCYNNKLESLQGAPQYIGKNFNCSYNNLNNLEGCPTIVDGRFSCQKNNKIFTKEYVRSLCDVKGEILC